MASLVLIALGSTGFVAIAVVSGGGFFGFLISSTVGKQYVIRQIIDKSALVGTDVALDIGCGGGQVLLEVASHIDAGISVGVDIWRRRDQFPNGSAYLIDNYKRSQIRNKIAVACANAVSLPFASSSFDLVTSNLVLHNIKGAENKFIALSEMVRVLKPDGRLVLADVGLSRKYIFVLKTLGLSNRKHSWTVPLFFAPFGLIVAERPA